VSEVTEKSLIKSISDNKAKGRRFAFLLGAGASVTSGIKGAGKLAEQWFGEIKENDPIKYQQILETKSFDINNIAASYTQIYQARFKDFPDDGYREIEELMSDDKVQPSFGYTVLAQVLNNTRHNVVLTTNFDRLTETALLYYQNTHARVIAHEEMLNVIAIHDQQPSIVKIHRDMQFSPMSEEQEVDNLDSKWSDIIRSLLSQYSLICLGYGGNDNGLMDILKQEVQNNSKAKVYWCYRNDITNEIKQLAKESKTQFKQVKVKGFDEFMLDLNQALGLKTLSNHIKEISENRLRRYEQELKKLTESTKDNGNLSAVKELVAESWWEIELEVDKEIDVEIKNKLYLDGLNKFKDSHELLGNYANFLTDIRKEHDKAEEYYLKALESEPKKASYNNNYAIFLKNIRKEHDKAEEYYLKALEGEPNNANYNSNYANFLKNIKKDYDKTEEYYLKILESEPNNAGYNNNYANFLTDIRKEHDKAEEYYLKALESEPNKANYNGNYANFLTDIRKEHDKAEEYYLKALESEPNKANYNGNYANFLKNIKKDYDKAEEYYLKALESEPNKANYNGNYANFLTEIRKEHDKAEGYYLKALELESNDANNNGNYASLLTDIRKDYDKAEAYYLKALELEPNDANHNSNYANFLLLQGKISKATIYLEKSEILATEPELKLELAFYRIALFPELYTENKTRIDQLLDEGHSSPGWDFSGIITQAKKQGNKNIDELNDLAQKISAI